MNKKGRWLGLSPLAFLFLGVRAALAAEDGVATFSDAEGIVERVLGAALPLLGLVMGIMIVVGGFQLLTSGGSKEGLQKAKGTFTFAIVGLVVAIVAWFILEFVYQFTSVPVKEFVIPN